MSGFNYNYDAYDTKKNMIPLVFKDEYYTTTPEGEVRVDLNATKKAKPTAKKNVSNKSSVGANSATPSTETSSPREALTESDFQNTIGIEHENSQGSDATETKKSSRVGRAVPEGIFQQKSSQEDGVPTDNHRSLLQAIMGWNDVPAGQKWNHFLQHGFDWFHGKPLEELLAKARQETANTNIVGKQQQKVSVNDSRAKQMSLNRDFRNLNTWYQEAKQGHHDNTDPNYDSPNGLSQQFNESVDNLHDKLIAQYPEEANEIETWFRPEYSQLSPRNVFLRNTVRNNVKTIQALDNIDDAVSDAARKGELLDENGNMKNVKVIIDTYLPTVSKALAEDQGSGADIELQRKQYLMAPDNVQEQLDKIFLNEYHELNKVLSTTAKSSLSADAQNFITSLQQAIGKGKTIGENLAGALGVALVYKDRSSLPEDLNIALTRLENGYGKALEKFMAQGQIDPYKFWTMLQMARDKHLNQYKGLLEQMRMVDNSPTAQNRKYDTTKFNGVNQRVPWLDEMVKHPMRFSDKSGVPKKIDVQTPDGNVSQTDTDELKKQVTSSEAAAYAED